LVLVFVITLLPGICNYIYQCHSYGGTIAEILTDGEIYVKINRRLPRGLYILLSSLLRGLTLSLLLIFLRPKDSIKVI